MYLWPATCILVTRVNTVVDTGKHPVHVLECEHCSSEYDEEIWTTSVWELLVCVCVCTHVCVCMMIDVHLQTCSFHSHVIIMIFLLFFLLHFGNGD
ncbi:hypothetical protein BDF22DRAFT_444456 [Syncephalis plumigaleata]|nr:hypothetical protein BDF22DRAFT_444456 [Syncephalis plumigaleata]